MRSLRFLLLAAAILLIPFGVTKANAEVIVGVGVGPAVVPGPVAYGPPVCEWGYYSYYPYGCAPYGYYGPEWFVGGVFIGAGPWYYYGWGHRYYRGRGWYGDHYRYREGYGYHGGYDGHDRHDGDHDRDHDRNGRHDGDHDRDGRNDGYHGGYGGHDGYHGSAPVRSGGGGSHGGGGFHGGGGHR